LLNQRAIPRFFQKGLFQKSLFQKACRKKAGLLLQDKEDSWLQKIIENVRGNLERLDQMGQYAEIFFDEKFQGIESGCF